MFGYVSQCNTKNLIYLNFRGVDCSFCIFNFLDFVKRVQGINLDDIFLRSQPIADVVILSPLYIDRCFVLTAAEVASLKDLLMEAKYVIQLNSVIRQCSLQTT